MKDTPRFFCDNCQCEVKRNSKACPGCGRFFAAIRCPSCGFIGDENTFSSGCPSCGYSSPIAANPSIIQKKKPEQKNLSGKLPKWVYILSIAAFITVIVILIIRLTN